MNHRSRGRGRSRLGLASRIGVARTDQRIYTIQEPARWFASQWLLYRQRRRGTGRTATRLAGNDFYEKSDNGGESASTRAKPGYLPSNKSWSRNLIRWPMPLCPVTLWLPRPWQPTRYLTDATWRSGRGVGRRGLARRIMNLIEFGVARGNRLLPARRVPGVDEMIRFSDNYGRAPTVGPQPSAASPHIHLGQAALAVGSHPAQPLLVEAQKDRWTA